MMFEDSKLDSFSFELDDKNYEVEDIIEKYSLEPNRNSLIDSKENSFILIFDFIQKIYNENLDISDDILKLINENLEFKQFYNDEIDKLLTKLTSSSSTLFFEQLTNITNLLSLGLKYEIFENFNNYSMDELSRLFREYEMKLSNTFEKEPINFDITIKLYTKLLDLLTKLCSVNGPRYK